MAEPSSNRILGKCITCLTAETHLVELGSNGICTYPLGRSVEGISAMAGSVSWFICRTTLRWLSFRWFFREISFFDIHKVDDRRCSIPPRHFAYDGSAFLRLSWIECVDWKRDWYCASIWCRLVAWDQCNLPDNNGLCPYPKSVLLTRRFLSPFVPPLRFPSNSRRINIQCWMSWNPISIKR